MIFVTVGSRKYPFDRLFKTIDKLYESEDFKEKIFAQIGTSQYIPKNFDYQKYVSQDEFTNLVEKADIVITHGASGSIMKALNMKKKVIVVTRLEKYGEHINDHQIQNNEAFSENNLVVMANLELTNLRECIDNIKDENFSLREWNNPDSLSIIKMIDNYISDNLKEVN